MNGNGTCKHLNFVIRSTDLMGMCFCPDCEEMVDLHACFNNLAEEMRNILAEVKEALVPKML